MSFDQAAVSTLFDRVQSLSMTLGLFEQVNTNEPKNAPGNGLTSAIWVQTIRGVGIVSGLSATSGVVTLNQRIYSNMLQKPEDQIDPNVLTAVSTLMNAYTGDLDLGDTVRNIDLLGTTGESLSAQAGYLTIDGKMYRVMTLTIPVIINDLWEMGV